jgi:hypothetical protein
MRSEPDVDRASAENTNAVVLCCDRDMFLPALSVATDAASRADGYDVVVVVEKGDIPAGFARWHAERGAPFAIAEVAFRQWLPPDLWSGWQLPIASAMRLMLPAFFDGRYRRLLYLDADVRLRGPVAGLFGLDLGGKAVAAASAYEDSPLAPDGSYITEGVPHHIATLGYPPGRNYFNAGVMLIDTEAWQQQRVVERAIDFIVGNREACRYFDQDGLNIALGGDYAVLSPGWNRRPDRFGNRPGHFSFETHILHYYGRSKPWNGGWGRNHADHYARFFAGLWPGAPDGSDPAERPVADAAVPIIKRIVRRLLPQDLRYRINLALGRVPLIPGTRHPRDIDAMLARYLAGTAFIDVEQGVVPRPWVARRYRPAYPRSRNLLVIG